MVYKDKEIIADPLYEVLFWVVYKEFVLIMARLGVLDMEAEEYDARKIVYGLILAFPVVLLGLLLASASLVTIFKFF